MNIQPIELDTIDIPSAPEAATRLFNRIIEGIEAGVNNTLETIEDIGNMYRFFKENKGLLIGGGIIIVVVMGLSWICFVAAPYVSPLFQTTSAVVCFANTRRNPQISIVILNKDEAVPTAPPKAEDSEAWLDFIPRMCYIRKNNFDCLFIEVTMNGITVIAFLDTGSLVNLASEILITALVRMGSHLFPLVEAEELDLDDSFEPIEEDDYPRDTEGQITEPETGSDVLVRIQLNGRNDVIAQINTASPICVVTLELSRQMRFKIKKVGFEVIAAITMSGTSPAAVSDWQKGGADPLVWVGWRVIYVLLSVPFFSDRVNCS
ncbi:hypothetical protein Ddc_13527 [Ditylenchus destructor]|nr:hypothetical protein Ddc_13527 [Ditylenchus destructor]